ncbi:LysR family transcriptional regulator [Aureimonas sp. Leaf324]|uniref:LysR family transcriptional regulator n=1 Tax=Aureimonas sp. Leaf324 TaxID=1736336 RepID=UPI0006FF7D9A|nr:LysR family transcriptional regulator [Aureimonas sp. Leaf324]KQQ85642.1 hypothetical protein ASF65_03575 [Aureimonas sp. Leaf324]
MDPRKLLYFACIAENGSFKKAAKQLEVSQPALSTSMDRLERELGEKLLDRSPTGVTLTPTGELIYAHARLIRDELDLAERRMTKREDQDQGTLTFGTLPSLAAAIVPKAVCRWQARSETPTLCIVEKVQIDLLLGLIRGEVSFIVGMSESYGFIDGLRQRVLFRDKLHVIARPDHPAVPREGLTWSDLAEYPWILQMLGKQRTLVEQLFAQEGLGLPRELTECGSVACIKTMVAESDNIALLPASAVNADIAEGRLRSIDIPDPLLHRDIAVMFRERTPLTDAGRRLVEEIEAAGQALS